MAGSALVISLHLMSSGLRSGSKLQQQGGHAGYQRGGL